jgi:hypothetical protein
MTIRKKIIVWSTLIVTLCFWLEGYSPLVYRWAASNHLFLDDYRNGDLYRLCYLPQFKEQAKDCLPPSVDKTSSKVHLYLIGDSFTEESRVHANDVASTQYTYVHWDKNKSIQLDTSARNILILESVERSVKGHFSRNANEFVLTDKPEVTHESTTTLLEKIEALVSWLIPVGIEERLEHVLFNYNWILKLREFKASMNLRLFNRVENKVVLSPEKDALFYFEEADSTKEKSSFYPVKQAEVDSMVLHINQTSKQYKDAGFDEVYLSIIPNKVSVISPNMGKYNHVIERIQTDSSLKVPLIDTYKFFKNSGNRYYLASDTHWNCEGRDLWLKEVNGLLKK